MGSYYVNREQSLHSDACFTVVIVLASLKKKRQTKSLRKDAFCLVAGLLSWLSGNTDILASQVALENDR